MIHKRLYNIYIASIGANGGIYRYIMDENGSLQFQDKTAVPNPLYLAISEKTMYAVLRNPFEGSADSGLITFDISSDGSLNNAGEIKPTLGSEGCHLCISDNNVYVVNYSSGSIIKMPDRLVRHHGSSVHPSRQTEPHPHFICPTPDGKYLCAADLGLDKILVYDKTLSLVSQADVPAGSGARHIAFSPDGGLAYCVNELSSTVSVFRYQCGKLQLLNTYSALPDGFDGENTSAAIRLNGNYLYVSNRGDDSITCFEIDSEVLIRKSITKCGGKSPRDFNIIGDFLLCTNESDDCVTQFRIAGDGLYPTENKLNIEHPLCVVFQERSE